MAKPHPTDNPLTRGEQNSNIIESAREKHKSNLQRLKHERELAEIENQKAQDQARANATRDLIRGDAEAGTRFAKEQLGLGEGSLGRQKKVSNIDDSRFRDLAKGLSAEELQANRDKAKEQINRSTQTQNRQLQALQQRQGIRGGTAGAQQLSILQGGEDRKADFERDLFLQDRQARVEGLNNLAEVQKYNQEQMVAQEKFNLAQRAQEKYDLAQSAISFAGLGSQERASERAKEAQEASAAASSGCFSGDTRVLMDDYTTKAIEDIKIGDRLFNGGVVYNVFQAANDNVTFLYNGVRVTGSHAVFHNDSFRRVQDVPGLDRTSGVSVVYNLSCKQHRIFVENEKGDVVQFADFDECYNADLSGEDRLKVLNEQ